MTAEKRLTPKQKKTIREKIYKEKQALKSARLLKLPEYNCTPRIQDPVPALTKSPRLKDDPASIMNCLMNWCPSNADIAGHWSWGQPRAWEGGEWEKEIRPKLLDFQNLRWSEIFAQRTGGRRRHKLHHDMAICDIISEACARWHEIGLDEYETAFRFRLAGKKRLWGYRVLAKFHLIWWDPKHKIYPIEV